MVAKDKAKKQRGFEVIITPSTMPGPFEKKEDNHG
jgi:hypothetical protein